MVKIRQITARDAETLSQVLCASIRELCSADHKNDPELIARWTANKTPEHITRWQVLLNYVAPAHRFCGVSRAILTYLEATLAERGISKARLTSTETAHRFYREAGWKDAGEPEIVFGIRGYPTEKELKPASGISG